MKITVITVCLNRGLEIEKTIQSVISQTFSDMEYWIIDGCSSDNTLQILEKYHKHLSFISEKDNGIYNAMNKGIERSNGKYLLFLNAGDYFKSDMSLQTLVNNSNYEDLIYGDITVIENDTEWLKTYPDTLSFNYFLNDTLPHPATLIKRSLFNKVGLLNEKNKIVSDWSFFTDAVCKFNATYKHVKSNITSFSANGISSLPENSMVIFSEKKDFLLKNYSAFLDKKSELHSQGFQLKLKQLKFDQIKSLIVNTDVYKILRKTFFNILI